MAIGRLAKEPVIQMNADLEIKYLGCSFRYRTYVCMQIAIVVVTLIAAGLFLVFAGDSEVWYFKYGWLICILVVVGEVVESLVAISRAKQEQGASLNDAKTKPDNESS